jgi:predicted nucleic acid-binding Zn ribbon protein
MNTVTRKNCIVCSTPLINHGNKRQRVYCSKQCCTKTQNLKKADGSAEYQRQLRAIKARIPDENKKKCAICGLWFT